MHHGTLKQVFNLCIYTANISVDWGALSSISRYLPKKKQEESGCSYRPQLNSGILQMDAKNSYGCKNKFQFTKNKNPLRPIKAKDTF